MYDSMQATNIIAFCPLTRHLKGINVFVGPQ